MGTFKILLPNQIQVAGRTLLYIGHLPQTQWHAHCCETWLFGLDGPLQVQLADNRHIHHARSAVIAANTLHILHAPDTRVGVVLLDPVMSATGHPQAEPVAHHRDAAHWIQTLNQGATITADDALWRPQTTESTALDPRVLAAAEQVDARLFENQPVSAVAKSVALSESRLQHLFASQTGLRLRQYRLWMRVLKTAGDAAFGHHSMTDAAHANGFSSSAHFSSSFRKSFGLAPSEILNNN